MQVYGIDLSMEKFDVDFINEKGKENKLNFKESLSNEGEYLIFP